MVTMSPGPPAKVGQPPPSSVHFSWIWELLTRPSEAFSTTVRIELYLDWEHEPSLPVMHCPVMAYRPPCLTAFWRVSLLENRYPKSMVPTTRSKKTDNEIAVSTSV